MMFVMIVEDNVNEAANLQKQLGRMRSDITFVTCRDGKDALDYLTNCKDDIDIFFLDIKLPTISGYTLATKIREEKKYLLTPIVFVTGHDMNALDAFQEYHCYSFIRKPFTEKTLRKNLSTFFAVFEEKDEDGLKDMKKVIYLSAREGEIFIYADQIIALEVVKKDCVIITEDNKYHIPRKSLDEELNEIGDANIIRCHKSFAVNVSHIRGLTKVARNLWEPIFDVENDDLKCYVSGTYYDMVMTKYKDNVEKLL